MKMKFLFFSLALFFSQFPLLGIEQEANTVLQGKVKGFEGKTIQLGIYEDFLTKTKKWVGESSIKDGKFRFEISLSATNQLVLKIEDKQVELFAAPKQLYNLGIYYDEILNQGKIHDKKLSLEFPFPKSENINLQIKKFNRDYGKFIEQNYRKFAINAVKAEIDQFVKKWEGKLPAYSSSEFVSVYIRYSLANLEDINKKPEKELFEKYLKNKPIRYRQKQYFTFFTQLYKQDFEQLTYTKRGSELLKAIMLDNNLSETKKLLMQYKDFQRAEFAELYLIYGLFDVYHKKVVNQKTALSLLEKISSNGESSANQIIARNVFNQLKQFSERQNAPNFKLKNTAGEVKELTDFYGKIIYLGFWSNQSLSSLKDLRLIQKLYQTYGSQIEFISINLDEDAEAYKKVKQENNYAWHFLHRGNDYALKKDYELYALPAYFLIDAEGKFIKPFAPGPLDIEPTLHHLIRK